MVGKKKKLKKQYRIKYKTDGSRVRITVIGTQEQAMERMKKELKRFPDTKAFLQVSKKSGSGWKSHSSYKYRKNKKTGRMRLVKL